MPFDKKQIIVIFSALCAVVMFVFLRYKPLKAEAAGLNQIIEPRQKAVIQSRQQKQQIPVLEQQLEKMQPQLARYENQIPQEKELGGFITRITGLMSRHNLDEQQVSPGEPQDITHSPSVDIEDFLVRAVSFEMECRGDIQRVFDFYRDLMKLDRLIRIERISLNSPGTGNDVVMQTVAVVYFRDPIR